MFKVTLSNPPCHAERSAERAPRGASGSAESKHIAFTAKIISGAGRGKALGTPTFNLALEEIPETLSEGVYAVRAQAGEGGVPSHAVMHYGPRPTFDGSRSCEVHLLEVLGVRFQVSGEITVEVVKKLRDVRRFETPEALQAQIAKDIADARTILS